jgi:ATP-dependent DNA helicase RecG
MTADQIPAWLASGESPTLEFKKSTAEKERACRTLCAFANGEGGRVLLGVAPVGKATRSRVSEHDTSKMENTLELSIPNFV